jgi:hypothetical protein
MLNDFLITVMASPLHKDAPMESPIKSRELKKGGPAMSKLKSVTYAAAGLSLLLGAKAALAAPKIIELDECPGEECGPYGDNDGPGAEQFTEVSQVVNGKQYVTVIWMSSRVPENSRPYQGKCTAFEMDPLMGPKVVADRVQISNYRTEQPFNHPIAIAMPDQPGKILYAWGDDHANGNTQTYVAQMDYMCNVMTQAKRVSNNNNNNQAAPDLAYVAPGKYVVGYYDNNNQRTYMRGLDVSGTTMTNTFLTVTTAPSNIGRPATRTIDGTNVLQCAAKGDQRPPEDGVECTLVNGLDGTIMWKQLIAKSDPGNKVYYNSPSLDPLGDGRFAVSVWKSSGTGKNNNRKGATQAQLFIVQPTTGSLGVQTMMAGVGEYNTHAALCGGHYGTADQPVTAIFDASVTGSGLAKLSFYSYDITSRTLTKVGSTAVTDKNGDSGYLANIYGNNPHTQGRDFMRCIGNVPNPGFGVTGGFMSDTKSFFIAPSSGMKDGQKKNSAFISFVPAVTTVAQPPVDPPTPPPPAPIPPDRTPPAPQNPGVGPENWGDGNASAPSMFGCNVGGGSSEGAAGMLLLVGVALLGLRRGNKE